MEVPTFMTRANLSRCSTQSVDFGIKIAVQATCWNGIFNILSEKSWHSCNPSIAMIIADIPTDAE